jgi:hypothetical protein
MVAEYRFMAELVGAFVPFERGEGVVVSVHSSAVNIRLPGGLLTSIVGNPSQMTSLSLCAPTLFEILRGCRPSILPGEVVELRGDSLLLARICLGLKRGKKWKGVLHEKDLRGFSLDNLFLIKEALLEVGTKEGLLGLIGGQSDLNPFALYASNRLNATPLEEHDKAHFNGLPSLIGLGPGFTPSGDDFITGVLAGERIGQVLWGLGRPFLEIDRRSLRTSLRKTNDAGRTLLWQALQDHFPCYLTEAVTGLAKARGVHAIGKVMSSAVAHGETSGTDALAGLVWYLEPFATSCNLPGQISYRM